MSDQAPLPEYPSIEKRIHALKGAPHGQVKSRLRRLQRARTASLKREIARLAASSRKGR